MAALDADRRAGVRVRVAAVLPRPGGGILLVRHLKDGHTYHLLPGGGVEKGETLENALIREVREETGLSCRPVRPLFINDTIAPDGSRHVVQITFLATVVDPDAHRPLLDGRLAGAETFALKDLDALDLRPPMAEQIVAAAAADFSGPTLYLGALWVDERAGATGPDRHAESDSTGNGCRLT